jgi:hypothetical protein
MTVSGDPAGVQGPILAQLDVIGAKLDAFAKNEALAGMPASAIGAGTKALLAERERLERELEAVTPPPTPTRYEEAMPLEEVQLRAEIEVPVDRIVIHPPRLPTNRLQPCPRRDRVALVSLVLRRVRVVARSHCVLVPDAAVRAVDHGLTAPDVAKYLLGALLGLRLRVVVR